MSGSKTHEAKAIAAKAVLMQQQAEERNRRAVELEVKRVEMEIKRTQLERQHRLELTKLEAERVVAAKGSHKVEKSPAKDNLMQLLRVPVASLPSVISCSITPVSVINPPLTSKPAVENPAGTTSMNEAGGICVSDPLVIQKSNLIQPLIREMCLSPSKVIAKMRPIQTRRLL